MNLPPILPPGAAPLATSKIDAELVDAALESVLANSSFGQKLLSSRWTKVAIGLVATVAGLSGWLVPLLKGSSSWEAKDAVIVIGLAGTFLGMLTSSGLAGVTRTAIASRVQAKKG
jgi:hypothetical protein